MDYFVIKEIFEKIDKLRKDVTQLMALVTIDSTKVDAINAAVDTLTNDTSKSLTDIAAEIAALKAGTADPVTSAALDAILTKVNALNTNVVAADPGTVIGGPVPNPNLP